jgi:2'-5' RNA ligase
MKRIFIAVRTEPGAVFQKMYSSLRSLLGNEKIAWINMDKIHLTIVFLGDTEEERIKIAGIVLKQKCTGFGEFTFALSGTGVFKNFNDPKVIWSGIKNPDKLLDLNKLIVQGLKDTGFRIEERQFRPHVTMARVKSINDINSFRSAVDRYKDTFFQEVHVKEVILFESILKPTGSVYRELGKFHL